MTAVRTRRANDECEKRFARDRPITFSDLLEFSQELEQFDRKFDSVSANKRTTRADSSERKESARVTKAGERYRRTRDRVQAIECEGTHNGRGEGVWEDRIASTSMIKRFTRNVPVTAEPQVNGDVTGGDSSVASTPPSQTTQAPASATVQASPWLDNEPVVKSPPEPTRVKSPEQMIMRSPEPVNWTVPLDTGKTFTVTQNVREGERRWELFGKETRRGREEGSTFLLRNLLVSPQL